MALAVVIEVNLDEGARIGTEAAEYVDDIELLRRRRSAPSEEREIDLIEEDLDLSLHRGVRYKSRGRAEKENSDEP